MRWTNVHPDFQNGKSRKTFQPQNTEKTKIPVSGFIFRDKPKSRSILIMIFQSQKGFNGIANSVLESINQSRRGTIRSGRGYKNIIKLQLFNQEIYLGRLKGFQHPYLLDRREDRLEDLLVSCRRPLFTQVLTREHK